MHIVVCLDETRGDETPDVPKANLGLVDQRRGKRVGFTGRVQGSGKHSFLHSLDLKVFTAFSENVENRLRYPRTKSSVSEAGMAGREVDQVAQAPRTRQHVLVHFYAYSSFHLVVYLF
jgi:hypothetical protein